MTIEVLIVMEGRWIFHKPSCRWLLEPSQVNLRPVWILKQSNLHRRLVKEKSEVFLWMLLVWRFGYSSAPAFCSWHNEIWEGQCLLHVLSLIWTITQFHHHPPIAIIIIKVYLHLSRLCGWKEEADSHSPFCSFSILEHIASSESSENNDTMCADFA